MITVFLIVFKKDDEEADGEKLSIKRVVWDIYLNNGFGGFDRLDHYGIWLHHHGKFAQLPRKFCPNH